MEKRTTRSEPSERLIIVCDKHELCKHERIHQRKAIFMKTDMVLSQNYIFVDLQ